MGGGDLNTKKSWHPNTMKNQERVWKAEQAAAEEKKRIQELKREREEERDRAQLKDLAARNFGAGSSTDNRLHWMYDNKPDKQTQQEDYLLGKEIGKNESESSQQNAIPAVSRRVVGSSMLSTGDDTQVDLARKLREDPLLLVKERERAARAALLNNPLQRKKLTELLRKEQEQKEMKSKKKSKKKDKDLDDVLAAKLNALGGNKGIDLTSLLNSDGGSSDSSSASDTKPKNKKKKKKQQKKKSKKSKKKKLSSESDSELSDEETDTKKSTKSKKHKKDSSKSRKVKKPSTESETDSGCNANRKIDELSNNKLDTPKHLKSKTAPRKRQSDTSSESESEIKSKRRRRDSDRYRSESANRSSLDRRNRTTNKSKSETNSTKHRDNDVKSYEGERKEMDRYEREGRRVVPQGKYEESARRSSHKRPGLSEEERAARLAEMSAMGAAREADRGQRVARERAREAAEAPPSARARSDTRALPDSLEARIRSNRHYIQRDRLHMNEHFARR